MAVDSLADPLLFSTVVSATLAVFGLLYVLSVRRDRRLVAFATVMVGTAIWTLGYSFEFASPSTAFVIHPDRSS